MGAWNDWYHVTGHTYGSWIPGDPRGWGTRHHRDHVEGNYKRLPPKGAGDGLRAQSRALMTHPPVTLSPSARRIACDVFAQSLLFHALEPLVVAIDSHHFHVLARFHDRRPRHWEGICKNRSARALSELGHAEAGGVWAVRCKVTPIHARAHQVQAFRYIVKHAKRGAATWRFDRP